ncbi:MAG: glycoside hydrolase family 99-like domain-containing protein [Anaerolineaceae bacterium]|nr:glycoside hydrolase family 99-like domain-containing protein [Anaerolineaceae bacterium]MDD4042918.1 glycoside hydrolase family 99-like domain-containing protein [Anaerolineaceae bacterium]MDD4578422.1 glycoside hydrolase family 99-like domain-containing protein [Anaerolineaceae bacterium]
MIKPRLIAYYLPQFHPIPENDAWWGEGFTEWTNVRKAKPLFKGHKQPVQPGELGYYDLLDPAIREAQAELARGAGIEGFCYWHYWFGGKQLLERPFNEVLASRKPDFPFCLAWANQSWTGIWHGEPDRILIKQTYPGVEDHIAHFNTLLPAFCDPRYLKVDGRPILFIFEPADLDSNWVNLWQGLAKKSGLESLYLIGIINNEQVAKHITKLGFDGFTISRTSRRGTRLRGLRNALSKLLGPKAAVDFYQKTLKQPFHVYNYEKVLPFLELSQPQSLEFYPCVMPGWDNTPRSGVNGHVFQNPTPEVFQQHLHQAIDRVSNYQPEHQLVILKSWNEWAEGNYLEPDMQHRDTFLQAIQRELKQWN